MYHKIATKCLLEISPRFALDKEDIRMRLARMPPIRLGDKLHLA